VTAELSRTKFRVRWLQLDEATALWRLDSEGTVTRKGILLAGIPFEQGAPMSRILKDLIRDVVLAEFLDDPTGQTRVKEMLA